MKAVTLNLEMRESEERYRTLFNVVPVAVYSCGRRASDVPATRL